MSDIKLVDTTFAVCQKVFMHSVVTWCVRCQSLQAILSLYTENAFIFFYCLLTLWIGTRCIFSVSRINRKSKHFIIVCRQVGQYTTLLLYERMVSDLYRHQKIDRRSKIRPPSLVNRWNWVKKSKYRRYRTPYRNYFNSLWKSMESKKNCWHSPEV